MNIGWPEGIYLALNLLGIGFLLAKGERYEMKTIDIILTWLFVTLPLLWWGGFFA